ncbi:MAG: heparinase II/III family protein [Chitinophagaceae bacterium]|nr:heparinase II/III family protein [Chitinophagaceae bacterium]
MKNLNFRLVLIILSIVSSVGLFAQDSISVQTKVPGHPRLLLLKGEEKALLRNIKHDTIWRKMHTELIKQADAMLTKPLNERVMEGRRLLGTSRDVLHKVFSLSYAYRMTGDKKYSDRAVAEMLKASSFEDWNPSHFLDVAEMTMALAIGYDWNYNRLSKNNRYLIKKAIVDKGLEPSLLPKNNYWLERDNNWNQVCNAGISLGALAVYEEDPAFAVSLLNRAIKSLPLSMKVYAPDGGYPEGAMYWGYGTSFNCIFLDAVEKIYKSNFGLADMPGFMKTGLFSQVMITPSLHVFAHSDSRTNASLQPAVFWFYNKTKDPVLNHFQMKLFQADSKQNFVNDRLFPLALLWGVRDGATMTSTVEPKELMWVTKEITPVAIMRSSWTDTNALYLGFKGGSPFTNHAHMDGGSFYFEAQGVRWGLDMGVHEYHLLEKNGVALFNRSQNSQRWDIFRISNYAHNTLTINNEKHLVMGNVPIETFSDDEKLMYVHSDLTTLFGHSVNKAKRSVAMVDKSYIMVEDMVTANDKPATIKWNMATEATKVTEVSTNTFLLTFKDKKLFIKVEGAIKLRSYFEPATPTLTFELPNPGVSLFGFEFDLAANETKQIKVYLMPEKEIEIREQKL